MKRTLSPNTQRILREAHEWHVRLEEQAASEEVKSQFQSWLNQDPRHETLFKHALQSNAMLETLSQRDIPQHLRYTPFRAIKSHLMDVIDYCAAHKGPALALSGLAAAGIALMVVLKPPQSLMPTVQAPVLAAYESALGQIKTITLSDGTEVTLGARSVLETRYFKDKRLVTLTAGAAYFDVTPDASRPFTVKAGDLTATALGTAFEVRRSGETYKVSVGEGTVKVGYPFVVDGKAMDMRATRTLHIGQGVTATATAGLAKVADVSTGYIAAWRDNVLVYDGVSVADLVADLNRYSPTPIMLDGSSAALGQLEFRGVFRDAHVATVLQTLASVHPIDIDISQLGRIILRKRNRS